MQMYFRLLKLLFRLTFFKYTVDPSKPFERDFRVSLTDIDLNRHITNSRYACFIDLVSVEFIIRSGTYKAIKDNNMNWLLVSSYKRYRRELLWNAKFTLRAKLVYIGKDSFYMEYQFIKDNFVYCHVVDKFVFVKKKGGKISPHKMFPWAKSSLFTPPSYIADLIKTESEFQNQIRKD